MTPCQRSTAGEPEPLAEEADVLDPLLGATLLFAPAPPRVAPAQPDWRAEEEPLPAELPVTMDSFSRALREAEILDVRAIKLPGAYVLLPFGVRLMQRYRALVRAALDSSGLEEHEYPSLIPPAALQATERVFPLAGRLLSVTHAGTERAVLAPTGEAAIYGHWARLAPDRFPIEMYRCATYFRPAQHGHRSGRSVFSAMETPDVFEFHCAYASLYEQQLALVRMFRTLTGLLARFRLPAMWSRRPGWTNHGVLFHSSYAADVPTPTLDTIFCGALYDQRQVLARAHGVRAGSPPAPAWHLTGAVSRRLVLCHLLLGLNADGTFLMHPDLCPEQVALVVPPDAEPLVAAARSIASMYDKIGFRTRLHLVPERQRRAVLERLARQATPLVITVRGEGADGLRMTLRRSDTGGRLELRDAPADLAVQAGVEAIGAVGHAYDRRVRTFAASRLARAEDLDSLRLILGDRRVGVLSVRPTPETTREIEGWGLGEVLGFRPGPGGRQYPDALVAARR